MPIYGLYISWLAQLTHLETTRGFSDNYTRGANACLPRARWIDIDPLNISFITDNPR